MENKMFVSKNDRSKWPARPEFNRSSPRSGWTLSVDRPLFSALLLALHAVHTFWSSGTRRTKTSATSLAKLLPVFSTTWRRSKVVWAPSLDAMTLSVLRDESSSSLVRPTNTPLSSTPISYIASPSPSWRRHFICVTRCSRRDGEGFTSFSCYDLWKKMLNQNILLIKYFSVYEVYLVSAEWPLT